jgi:thiamine-monophosphate kinase
VSWRENIEILNKFQYLNSNAPNKRINESNMNNKNQGELALIKYIRDRFPKRRKEIVKGIGDDALVLRDGIIVSTDSFFEGVHFDMTYFSPFALGYHCMAASLSDLAAMAASPICALVSLNLSKHITKKEVGELYSGFEKITKQYKMDIAGGDIVASPAFGMTITVIGHAKRPLMRSGAQPGQALYMTNFLGLAEIGRRALRDKLPKREYPDAIEKHLYPEPRIFEAQTLRRYSTACIDTSDGLSTDAFHLAEESRVKIIISEEHIPIHPEVGKLCTIEKVDPVKFILSAGEDFELLFTAWRIPKLPKVKIFKIGTIEKGRGLYLSKRGGITRIEPSGYEHLK